MRVVDIVLWTFGVFFAAVALLLFFPVAITILGFFSIGVLAREIGSYYDEVYNKASRERELDKAHQQVKVIRIKNSTTRTPKSA